jgi:hypothetical protein
MSIITGPWENYSGEHWCDQYSLVWQAAIFCRENKRVFMRRNILSEPICVIMREDRSDIYPAQTKYHWTAKTSNGSIMWSNEGLGFQFACDAKAAADAFLISRYGAMFAETIDEAEKMALLA